MKLDFFRQFLDKYSNIKFHENPSNGSRAVSCGQTDMTKQIVAFRNFANALEIDKAVIILQRKSKRGANFDTNRWK